MGSERRHTLPLRVIVPNLESLKDLSSKLTESHRDAFVVKYGNILDLLFVKVQPNAVTTLAQFYDRSMRCFTFQDFQLAPTLEEFARILGYSLRRGRPFTNIGQIQKLQNVAKALDINVRELAKNLIPKENGKYQGFTRKYLEEKAIDYAKTKEWKKLNDVLALLIYGIVLFPNIPDFIDLYALNIFLAVKIDNEYPVPTLLADVYYSLDFRHEKKGGVILCCIPLLYTWFMSHYLRKGSFIEYQDNSNWPDKIKTLTENSITWYLREHQVDEIIFSCGDFPNVPLIGSKGCINYNPTLALRQLGYPMLDKPDDKSLEGFVLHDMGANDLPMLRRIRRAWDRIHRKGSAELGRKNCIAKEPYREWVIHRVHEIKLPFPLEPPTQQVQGSSEPIPISFEEVEELKETILKLEKEKEELQTKLEKTTQENKELRWENTRKEQIIEESNKRLKVEEFKKNMVKDGLKSANGDLYARNQQYNDALYRAGMFRELWEESVKVEKSLRKELDEDLKKENKCSSSRLPNPTVSKP